MAIGKTIQIFLPDGNPLSLKIAEITSRTVQAIYIPRAKMDIAVAREELKNVGIYFLIGTDGQESIPLLYVGEAEDCLVRLKQHNAAKTKDFWNVALAIISKTHYFTKTHIRYLEWFCYTEAQIAARYSLINTNKPAKPHISESMEADLFDNYETIKMLVSTLGFPIFDRITKPEKKEILFCKGKNALAEGEYTEEGFIVFTGSKCNVEETNSVSPGTIAKRRKLLADGILKKDGTVYIFTSNFVFNSPSTASDVVLGRSSNGWTSWKYKNGKTLDEIKRNTQ